MITKSGQRSPESEQVAAGPSDASPPPYEAAWENSLNRLQNKVTAYNDVEQQGREPTAAEAQQVADAMQHVGDSHPDPKVKGDWHRRAAKFRNGTRSTRRGAVREVRGIVGGLLSIPCMLVGTALHIVGGVLHTAASIVGGVADAVTGSSRGDHLLEYDRKGKSRVKD